MWLRRKIYYPVRMTFGSLIYDFFHKKFILPKVLSIEETIETIISKKSSISRFGDGELLLMDEKAKTIVFQKADKDLRIRLIEVFNSQTNNHLICLPESWRSTSNLVDVRFFKSFIAFNYSKIKTYLDFDRIYYNACISRLYRDYVDKSQSSNRFKLIKEVWKNRDVVLFEGEFSRIGVGTDLFSSTKSMKRILCPTADAYGFYGKILENAKRLDKSYLILIALGPTATVLAFDLHNAGYQAIDIGHIGSEYFSYLKIEEKFDFESKYKANINSQMHDDVYNSEILTLIK